ncbi:MAG TPA: TetR/AcrR family transcriptional regulator, partial [Pedobacter sp.]
IVIGEILSGEKKLFGKHGLKKTTMEEIATAAGKGKSTLYYYFPSKNEIFEAVVEDEMKNVVKRIREAVNASLTAKEKLKAFLQAQITSIIGFHSFREVLFDDLVTSMRMLIVIKSRYEQIQIDMIREILLGGSQSGEFKEMSTDRMNKMSFVMVTAFRGLHFPLSVELSELQTNEYFDEMIDMLIAGIGTETLKKKIE